MVRPPQNLTERIRAHCRPQPAIPAVLVLLLTLMWTATAAPDGGPWLGWAAAAGLAASCALAIAAGFCSFFPPLVWIGLLAPAIGLLSRLPDPAPARGVAFAGIAGAAGMLVLQVWRVKTGRFVATVEDPEDPGEASD